jgi:hypothetical protein
MIIPCWVEQRNPPQIIEAPEGIHVKPAELGPDMRNSLLAANLPRRIAEVNQASRLRSSIGPYHSTKPPNAAIQAAAETARSVEENSGASGKMRATAASIAVA